jgi:hypothetical protein
MKMNSWQIVLVTLFLGFQTMIGFAYLFPSYPNKPTLRQFVTNNYQIRVRTSKVVSFRGFSTIRYMMQKPPKDSPYLQPEENKSPFHKRYQPDKSYPGTLAPGTAPENRPADEIPTENIIPYPHFQTWPYHFRLPPYRPYQMNFEESLTAQGRMVSEEEANRRSRLTSKPGSNDIHSDSSKSYYNSDVDNALSDLKGSLLTPGQTQPTTKGKKEKKTPAKRGRKKKETSMEDDEDSKTMSENTDVLDFNDFNQNEDNQEEDEDILDADEYLLEEALKLQLGDKREESDSDNDGDSTS